jgi:hypothetical protein
MVQADSNTTDPLVQFTPTPPQPPPGTLVTPPRDATSDFSSLGTASSVDELVRRIVEPTSASPEPNPTMISVQEMQKGADHQITLRVYGLQDDSTGGSMARPARVQPERPEALREVSPRLVDRDYTIVVRSTAGGWAMSSATAVSECRRGVARTGRLRLSFRRPGREERASKRVIAPQRSPRRALGSLADVPLDARKGQIRSPAWRDPGKRWAQGRAEALPQAPGSKCAVTTGIRECCRREW